MGHSTAKDTITAYFLLDGHIYNGSYQPMQSNINYKFSLTTIRNGLYYLRLDVNQEGKTHTFSNISVKLIVN